MSTGELERAVAEREWYHTLELPGGIVTPGFFDLRPAVARLPFPASLEGKRCLDIGTFDGFWAFEMERRGAADVVAIDILEPSQWDWPAGSEPAAREGIGARKGRGEGFEIAHRALRSRVKRLERSIYDLDVAQDGEFDVVYLGSLLLHLRDPIGALRRVRAVCRGELIAVDAIDPFLDRIARRRPALTLDAVGRPWWFKPNAAALQRMVEAAGFEVLEGPLRLRLRRGAGHPRVRLSARVLLSQGSRAQVWAALLGDPHAAVLARAR